jgi:thiamine-monophosphate kinase
VTTPLLGPGHEFDRIRAILRDLPPMPEGVLLGPGDDAALLEPDLVISTDLAIEGVHFDLDWITPLEAGRRAAAAALSDLAAMGAAAQGLLASLALPTGRADVGEALMAGVRARIEALGGALLGGDLTRSPGPIFLDIVVVGRASTPLLRSGGRPGDELWVTGHLGGAAAAVESWQAGSPPPAALRRAYADPEPRIAPALWLVGRECARAAIDLSDGLAGDAAHLAAASGLRIELDSASIPLHPQLSGTVGALELALHGGDDYELLFACRRGALSPEGVEEFRRTFDLEITRVGLLTAGSGVFLRPADGGPVRPIDRGGYDHFHDER